MFALLFVLQRVANIHRHTGRALIQQILFTRLGTQVCLKTIFSIKANQLNLEFSNQTQNMLKKFPWFPNLRQIGPEVLELW